jgi:hypothetical protein
MRKMRVEGSFGDWLAGQDLRDDDVGLFARHYIDDVGNQCCYALTTAGIIAHIERKHSNVTARVKQGFWKAAKEWQEQP